MSELSTIEEIKKYLGDDKHGLISELFNAINEHCFFMTVAESNKNNIHQKLATNNVMLSSAFRRGYTVNQIITIGRLVDKDKRSISLRRIICELIKIGNFDNLQLKTLDEIINANENINKVVTDRNQLIAHLDKERFSTSIDTKLEVIEHSLIVLAYVAKKLSYMLSQTIETFHWYPSPECRDIFNALDFPFFFASEKAELTTYFLDYQKDIDEKIKDFTNISSS